jgi:hypothetical protein
MLAIARPDSCGGIICSELLGYRLALAAVGMTATGVCARWLWIGKREHASVEGDTRRMMPYESHDAWSSSHASLFVRGHGSQAEEIPPGV